MTNARKFPSPASNPTRRQLIAGVTIALGSLALASTEAFAQAVQEISHSEDSIHQEPVFKARRKRVYEALTDAKQFQKVTQLSAAVQSGMAKGNIPAEIVAESGGAFKFFNGLSSGGTLNSCPTNASSKRGEWPTGLRVTGPSSSSS